MARNYSNTVSGTISLAAGMTAVQTTATVSDASTLPAVDFTILVDDEVMLVTGKAGATLTVRRGFDGTTPAVHSSGAAVRHVVVAADVGKTLVRGPMVVGEPTSAVDPMDDLFDDGSIAAKWTQRNAGAAATWTEDADGLWYTVPAKTGWQVSSIMQAAPAGDFRVEFAYHVGDFLRQENHAPICLLVSSGADTSSPLALMRFAVTGGSQPQLTVTRLSNYSTFSSHLKGNVATMDHEWGLMAFQRSGTTWSWLWSRTGRLWQTIHTMTELWSIVEVGPALNVENGSFGMSSGFRWFRRVS